MNEAEGINFKVNAVGSDEKKRKCGELGLDDIKSFVDNLSIGQKSKDYLMSLAKKMPNGFLPNFKTNYRQYLKRPSSEK